MNTLMDFLKEFSLAARDVKRSVDLHPQSIRGDNFVCAIMTLGMGGFPRCTGANEYHKLRAGATPGERSAWLMDTF